MEFRVLGPLEVLDDGRALGLGGPKQRSLLALLMLNANRVVSTDRLIDEVWGESAEGAARTLQVYVSNLRKLLEPRRDPGAEPSVLVTRKPGYVLCLESAQLDLLRFEALLTEGRAQLAAGDATGAAATLHEALELWRGALLADLADEPFVIPETARLEHLRLDALETCFEAELAQGRHGEIAGELEAAVVEHPLRERLWAQLMMALYRSDRQADALRAYGRLRSHLGEELGIEPSRELARLEQAILLQEPDLDWTRTAVPERAVNIPGFLPSGVVTFLLTDVEGSTRLWEADATAMAQALGRHDAILAEVVASHGGVLLKARGEGDSTFSVFVRATDAAAAALAAEQALNAESWPPGTALSVRMALHTGEALERDGDYYGRTVNRVARLRGIATGGQVLVSRSTAEIIRDHLRPDATLAELGDRTLRDLARPERVYALTTADLAPLPGTRMTTVAVIDDHPVYRQGLADAVARSSDWAIIGTFDSVDAYLEADSGAEVILLDYHLPGLAGPHAVQTLTERGAAVLMVSADIGREAVLETLAAGARGYVAKHADVPEILEAIRIVSDPLNPGTYVSATLASYLLDASETAGPNTLDLTAREREVLAQLAAGERDQDIADALFIRLGTVRAYLDHIRDKTGHRHRPRLPRPHP